MTPVLKAPSLQAEPQGSALLQFYRSPIGKKLITGLTGLGLTLFVLVHMIGNLLLFAGSEAYNAYAVHLTDWGIFLYLIEAALLLVFLLHMAVGVEISVRRFRARPEGYRQYASAGEPSLQSPSSRTMILTGTVLAIFLVFHLMTFKFGAYYATDLNGAEARDLARLVLEKFHEPVYTFGYTAVMVLLGFHLRHGVWSALQSLGVMSRGWRFAIYGLGTVFAVLMAAGFCVLPLAIYFGGVG